MGEPEVWIESERVRLTSARLARWLGWTALAMCIAPLMIATLLDRLVHVRLYDAVAYGFLLAPLLGLASLVARRKRGPVKGAVGVVDRDLVLVRGRERRRIPLADLASGWVSPTLGEVEIVRRGGDAIHAAVPRPADAERLLVAAGLDASKRTMRLKLGETTFLTALLILLGPSVAGALAQVIGMALALPWFISVGVFFGLFALLFFLVHAAFGPAELLVGADGIVIDRALGDQFVPHDQLDSITMKPDAVVLLLRDGSRVRARARHLTRIQQGELRARIDAGIAAFRRGESDAEALSQLDRGGRAIDAWREALRALLDRQGSYRETPLTREQLLAVLESPAAPAERRLAAAVSLSAAGDAEIAARIRVAAEACARPRVRVALAGVAEGDVDDAAIEAAIAEDEASMSRA